MITDEHLSLPPLPWAPAHANTIATTAVMRPRGSDGGGTFVDLKAMERSLIERAMCDARQNKSKAARLLGLSRSQLYVRLRRYSLA